MPGGSLALSDGLLTSCPAVQQAALGHALEASVYEQVFGGKQNKLVQHMQPGRVLQRLQGQGRQVWACAATPAIVASTSLELLELLLSARCILSTAPCPDWACELPPAPPPFILLAAPFMPPLTPLPSGKYAWSP